MTKEEKIRELEKQVGPITNEPNQAEIDRQTAEALRKGIKR